MAGTRPQSCGVIAFVLLSAAVAETRQRSVGRFVYGEGGYASRTSVAQNGQITFHIASSVSPFTMSIVNLADPGTVLREVPNLTSRPQDCSGRYASGCGWPATHTLTIPGSWPSGFYAAVFPTGYGERKAIFVVREDDRGSSSRVLIVSATNTYQAYNAFGGRSLYPSNDPNRSSHVSFDRPYDDARGLGRYDEWEQKFVDWMQQERRTFEVVTDDDLEDPTLLANYSLVVLVGHSEYWTSAARQNLETFIDNGGHLAVLGGVTMWWQARYENEGRTLVCYKDAATDPIRAIDARLVTTHFWSEPVNSPENLIAGSSFRFGGYANRVDDPGSYAMLPVQERTGYFVAEENHWVFEGTSVQRSMEFGREAAGLEVDGALFNCDATTGRMTPDGSDGTPLNFHILAVTPAWDGHGTIGILTNPTGGTVFNAGTMNWAHGLDSDPVVRTATRNVLSRLGSGQRQVYDPVSSPILMQELFNCPQASKTFLPGWQSDRERGRLTTECGYEGPAGLRLSGSEAISLSRDFTPTGDRDHVEMRFHVKVDELVKRNQFPAPILTLRTRAGSSIRQVASAEFDVVDSRKAVRVARRDPSGRFFASDWIVLGTGWHLVELSWSSPGTITLQVDGGSSVSLNNPDANQFAGEIVIDYPRANGPDAGHACLDAIAVATEKLGPAPGLR